MGGLTQDAVSLSLVAVQQNGGGSCLVGLLPHRHPRGRAAPQQRERRGSNRVADRAPPCPAWLPRPCSIAEPSPSPAVPVPRGSRRSPLGI